MENKNSVVSKIGKKKHELESIEPKPFANFVETLILRDLRETCLVHVFFYKIYTT